MDTTFKREFLSIKTFKITNFKSIDLKSIIDKKPSNQNHMV